jgi:hypothetical protein
MAWWPFATTPEKADTMEVTGLNNYARPLYSAGSACPVECTYVLYSTGVRDMSL